ncbi:hypothetical protein FP2506_12949 [Fulvimarina pelagi HTCC2506]|uniref:Uncharacterized protein n=1 Tax=Fulvimarina pelagi HTCC2506 TaxID=314231 RepID=Q0G1A6_9HYPH|nr:hypothetical protein FP2506_12949 [Fulvimarina pelagi HTCC2506]
MAFGAFKTFFETFSMIDFGDIHTRL